MFFFRISFPSLCLCVGLSLLAVPASAVTLSLQDIAARVRGHHPGLKAARLAIEEARGRQLGAGRLANPVVSTEFQNESRVSPRTTVFSLDQSFPLTKRLALEKKLTAQQVEAAGHEVRDAERRYIAEARELAVKLLATERQKALRMEQTEQLKKLASYAEGRVKAGEISPLDAVQPPVVSRRLQLEARLLENECTSLRGALKPLLGLKPAESLTLRGDLSALGVPKKAGWQQRGDYLLARNREESARTEVDLARARRVPDLTAGLFASREQQDVTPANTERTGFVGFRLSLPLPFWNKNQGEIAEKTAGVERARLETEALVAQIDGEADTARREMEAQAALAREARDELLPPVALKAEELEKAYPKAQTDMQTVLWAFEQKWQLQAAALDAERDFHLARIRYEAATGAQP